MLTYTFKRGSENTRNLRAFPSNWAGRAGQFTVNVEKSTGLIGKPSLKSVENFDWKYLHGTTPDLHNRRYQSKEITLQCWIAANSKQQMVEYYDEFLRYFTYDDLILMKVTWDTDNDYGGYLPNPHDSKGLFALVWLKSVKVDKQKWRFGKNHIRFTLTFEDPYPVKRIYYYTGEDNDGVNYDIVSDSEIDIFTDKGDAVYDILSNSGTIDCGLNTYILVCGDVGHATDSNGGVGLITPISNYDTVNLIYSEI